MRKISKIQQDPVIPCEISKIQQDSKSLTPRMGHPTRTCPTMHEISKIPARTRRHAQFSKTQQEPDATYETSNKNLTPRERESN